LILPLKIQDVVNMDYDLCQAILTQVSAPVDEAGYLGELKGQQEAPQM
jgi:hypothetical protein